MGLSISQQNLAAFNAVRDMQTANSTNGHIDSLDITRQGPPATKTAQPGPASQPVADSAEISDTRRVTLETNQKYLQTAQRGINAVNTMTQSLAGMKTLLGDLNTLFTGAGSAVPSDNAQNRLAIAGALGAMDRISQNTTFEGQRLHDGATFSFNLGGQNITVGAGESRLGQIAADLAAGRPGMPRLSVSSPQAIADSLTSLATATNMVDQANTAWTQAGRQLQNGLARISVAVENASASARVDSINVKDLVSSSALAIGANAAGALNAQAVDATNASRLLLD